MKVVEHKTTNITDGEEQRIVSMLATSLHSPDATVGTQNGTPPVHRPDEEPMSTWERTAIGWGVIVLGALLFTQLLAVWPAVIAATTVGVKSPMTPVLFGLKRVAFQPQVSLLLMIAIVGSLASLVELIRAFTKYSGRGELSQRWTWWYALRPVQGAALAVIVYFALRGGLLGVDNTKPLNPYGLAAFAGLVGLFTRHAVTKLSDVFDTMFGKPAEDANIQPKPAPAANGSTPGDAKGTTPHITGK